MICPLRGWGGARTPKPSKGSGADDDTTGRVVEGDGQEDELGGRSRDHRGKLPDDETVAGADGGGRLRWSGGSTERQAQCKAGRAEDSGTGTGAVSGNLP